MSRVGKKPVVIPAGVTAKLDGQTIAVKGAKGELNFAAPDDVVVSSRRQCRQGRSAFADQARPRHVGHVARDDRQSRRRRDAGLRAQARNQRRRLQGGGRRQESANVARLQPRHHLSDSRRCDDRDAEADGSDHQRQRQAAGRTSGRRNPGAARARALQGQGHQICREFIFRKEGKKK